MFFSGDNMREYTFIQVIFKKYIALGHNTLVYSAIPVSNAIFY